MPVFDDSRWDLLPDGSRQRKSILSATTRGGQPLPPLVNATAGAIELAEELGIDLSGLTGTGPGGRVTKTDVKRHAG